MSLEVNKYFTSREIWLSRFFNMLKYIQLSRCCFFFTLRQGTILIAFVELTITSFVLFLLILCATHAQEIATLTAADLQQLEENSYWLADEDTNGVFGVPLYYSNNEKRMHNGQHLATVVMLVLYVLVLLASIHLLSCLMLLYGALKNYSNFLLPWTSTVLLSLICAAFTLPVLIFSPYTKCRIIVCYGGFTALLLGFYWWLVVFSFYRQLTHFSGSCRNDVECIAPYSAVQVEKYPKTDI